MARSDTGSGSEIVLYQTEDNHTRVHVRLDAGTVWLTQAQVAELFQTTPRNTTIHVKAIFAEGALEEAATCKDYLQVRDAGGREVRRTLKKHHTHAGKVRAAVAEDLARELRAADADDLKAFETLAKRLPRKPKGKRS